jgi:hypothetical protein
MDYWSGDRGSVSDVVCCQVMPGVSRRSTTYERTARLAADPTVVVVEFRCPSLPQG